MGGVQINSRLSQFQLAVIQVSSCKLWMSEINDLQKVGVDLKSFWAILDGFRELSSNSKPPRYLGTSCVLVESSIFYAHVEGDSTSQKAFVLGVSG
jgi:hypothetical protein